MEQDRALKNIAFIINPISGTHAKTRIPKQVKRLLGEQQFLPSVVFTEYAGHATQLARQFAAEGYYAVVAVGGDGTVNEVASGVCGTETAMGIIPNGSGNGFARHLGISTRVSRAIELLNRSEVISADYGIVNGRPFFSTCGIGFDALVAHQFAQGSSRGFTTYLQNIVKDLFQYKPETYRLVGEGFDQTVTAFLITFANAGQWGYDAYIAPKASIQDGLMDITIVTKFPMYAAPGLALSLFTRSIDQDLYVHTIRTREVTMFRCSEGPMHIDGDPVIMPQELQLHIVADGLRLLVAKRF